jgi:PIN domain nuclease of toxin-antitoxin system
MTVAVLDASALLALLLAEPGQTRVQEVLAHSAVTSVNIAEVIGHFARHGATQQQIRSVLDPLPVDRVPFDEDLAYRAGLLTPVTRSAGLSFGDRACLALAHRLGVVALTVDRAWSDISRAAGVSVELIR